MISKRYPVALALLLLAGGCGLGDDPEATRTFTAHDIEFPSGDVATEPAQPAPAQGRSETIDNELYEFKFAWPAAAAAYPGLNDLLGRKLAAAQAEVATNAKEEKEAAEQDGFPFRKHSSETDWKVVTSIPGWFSLSSDSYFYTGGAHGMSMSDALLWDEKAGTARKVADLFTSEGALRSAIQSDFCNALDKERSKRRGTPVNRESGEMFSECIDPLASTLILGSANGQTFDRIGVLIAPYEAGPYAEGEYEVTLPVSAAVMRALKPQYRTSFSPGR